MDNYQHILLAVDFSEHGNHVTRKAAHLAEIFHAKLSIIHVLDNIPMPDTAYGTIIPLNENSTYELLEVEKSKLKQIGNQLRVEPTLRWMVWGVPGQEIVRIAEKEHVDLIVIGSHGRHGLALLLGSTASDVLHHAKCDVMAIRLQDKVTDREPLLEKAALGPSG
ncbi:universal stress protein [Nitrosovibrio sp. Nv6]|uniref:universal stress protein n=1 Tax=Nitrosovibrio sp. Nv6 TaxID=1855340 RepID=UPI0008CC44C6|nr:universal stress protein [Nitrosovibrio sp. Nv6]SEO76217.1 universal stress protein A [Nitrosovibrio sp. Nv6]